MAYSTALASGEEQTKSAVFPAESSGRRALVFWEGFAQTIPLPRVGTLTIGRAPECDVRIDHISVSRRHAALHVGASLAIQDLGSSNGTRLGGHKIGSGAIEPLAPGALVEIGLATIVIHGDDLPQVAHVGATNTHVPEKAVNEPTLDRLHRLIDLVAASRISVVLLGETGVGKEVAAELVHSRSPRANKPLIKINCAALPESLLEAELFGYERGAFTGATQAKQGLIEVADGGTLFLDEVAEIPLGTQAKLLRVLESREVMRLGALTPKVLDVRFVAATNRDLESSVKGGSFREDLYYRLNGMTITIPPLRDRRLQIPSLAQGFLAQAAAENGVPVPKLTPQALRLLERHDWPGNVRELRNVVERALVLAGGGPVEVDHLPGLAEARAPEASAAPASAPLKGELAELEKKRILEALEQSAGNQSRAAELLGVSRRTLLNRLDAYNVARPRKPAPPKPGR